MKSLTVVVSLSLAIACAEPPALRTSVPAPVLPTLKLTTDGPRLKDALGRTVLLRGVNAGGQSKRPPYFPFAFSESGVAGQESAPPFEQAAEQYASLVADRGFTVVRQLFMWEAVEPTRGTYDDVYVGRLVKLAQAFGKRGIRVVLDHHQDVYARVFCGNGFPEWTLEGHSATPPSSCDPWYGGYLGRVPDMSAAYDRLYANTDGVQEKFIAQWRHVAHAMASVDNVVAFEIMNEPYFGTADEKVWAGGALRTFFENVGAALREEAPGRLLFFEPSGTSPQIGGAISARPEGTDWVWAPHYYEPEAFILGADESVSWQEMTTLLQPIADVATQWNVPVFLGEFGISNIWMNSPRYLAASWDALDARQLSGTCWHFSTTPDFMAQEQLDLWRDGKETAGLDASVRPQAAVVAGNLQSFTYDTLSGTAVLSMEATANGVTELVLPSRRYPKEPTVTVEGPHIRYEHDTKAQRLRITVPKGGSVKVTIAK